MNIRMVPFTWARHIHAALVVMAATLVGYWGLLAVCAVRGPFWSPTADLNVLLGVFGLGAGAGAVLVQGSLESKPGTWWRKGLLVAALGGFFAAHLGAGLGARLTVMAVPGASEAYGIAPVLSVLKYSLASFVCAGLFFGLLMGWWRKASLALYANVGIVCGLGAAMTWHLTAGIVDLYAAAAAAAMAWGGAFGLLAWVVPSRLYAGWIRVLSGSRFGVRVRVDGDGDSSELVAGHYPRGMDLWLPAEEGVREMHLSVAVDAEQNYKARGLSLYPTRVKRSLEKLDLRYDPARPLPLETPLSSGDLLQLGDGQSQTVLEFVMLPREEDQP